jgi:hypothetical protein
MLDYLDAEIAKRKAEIARLDQRRHDMEVELRTYEEIRTHICRSNQPRPQSQPASASFVGSGTMTATVKRTKLADHWRVVLRRAVERFPEAVKTAEVPEIQRSAGYDASSPANVRSHFHKLRHEGLYEDAGWGAVRATKAAAEIIGVALGNTKQSMGMPNGQPPFGEPDRETAGRTHEANPAASVHH